MRVSDIQIGYMDTVWMSERPTVLNRWIKTVNIFLHCFDNCLNCVKHSSIRSVVCLFVCCLLIEWFWKMFKSFWKLFKLCWTLKNRFDQRETQISRKKQAYTIIWGTSYEKNKKHKTLEKPRAHISKKTIFWIIMKFLAGPLSSPRALCSIWLSCLVTSRFSLYSAPVGPLDFFCWCAFMCSQFFSKFEDPKYLCFCGGVDVHFRV